VLKVNYCTGPTTITNAATAVNGARDPVTGNNTGSQDTSVTDPGCDDGNPCTVDSCDPSLGCQHVARNAGAACRPSAGQCDVAETCTGTSATCPSDVFASDTTSCMRASQGGACDNDAADHCTGTSNTCVDAFQSSTFVCRPAADACDAAETCTGTSAACPADGFQPS